MAISETAANALVARAKDSLVSVHFKLSATDDDCIVDIEFRPGETAPVVLTENWYNTDCVGPSHGGTERCELTEQQAVARLVEFVEEPYETKP